MFKYSFLLSEIIFIWYSYISTANTQKVIFISLLVQQLQFFLEKKWTLYFKKL